MSDLWQWQHQEVTEHGDERKRAIFASPRTGKTRCAIAGLKRQWHALEHGCVIVAPLVVCPMWEAALHDAGLPVTQGYKQGGKLPVEKGVLVVNWDRLASQIDNILDWGPDYLIADESHKAKGVKSDRGKAFRRLAWDTPWVRLLTGTPAPNHYGDLWGQMVALDKEAWGSSYESFARRYLIRDSMFPSRVLGHINVEELQEKLLRYSSIVRREDVFGPDTWQEVVRTITLPPKVYKLYDKLVKEWIVEVEGQEIDATHILTRLVRLQQLAAGYLTGDERVPVDIHAAKVDAVLADLDEIMESGEKAVVFHRFAHEGANLYNAISARYGTFKIDGSTPSSKREEYINRFRDEDGPSVMVAQTQSAGIGVSFAEARHVLFTSLDFSFADHLQARDRVYKPGENRCVTYYLADNTVDEYIKKVLDAKGSVHEAVRTADIQGMAYGKFKKAKQHV